MNAHSAKTCQCSSRTPPAVSRMLTPAMVSEIWKSACVTCRAQPPFWIRFGALLNDAQNCGRSPTSVAGGDDAAGNWSASTGLCGPGSVTLAGFVALTAPCGGSSGLPNAREQLGLRRQRRRSRRVRRCGAVLALVDAGVRLLLPGQPRE